MKIHERLDLAGMICFVSGMTNRWVALLLLVALFAVVSCKKPAAPTIKPESAELVLADDAGLVVRVHAAAHNPHSVPLPITNVKGTLSFNNEPAAGVSSSSIGTLQPNADTPVSFDIRAPWRAVAKAVGRSKAGDIVPYKVAGTATMQAGGMSFDVPFATEGTVEKKKIFLQILKHVPLPRPEDIRQSRQQ